MYQQSASGKRPCSVRKATMAGYGHQEEHGFYSYGMSVIPAAPQFLTGHTKCGKHVTVVRARECSIGLEGYWVNKGHGTRCAFTFLHFCFL
jgi:hypothetical protein